MKNFLLISNILIFLAFSNIDAKVCVKKRSKSENIAPPTEQPSAVVSIIFSHFEYRYVNEVDMGPESGTAASMDPQFECPKLSENVTCFPGQFLQIQELFNVTSINGVEVSRTAIGNRFCCRTKTASAP